MQKIKQKKQYPIWLFQTPCLLCIFALIICSPPSNLFAQTQVEISPTPIIGGQWNATYNGILGIQIHSNIPFQKNKQIHWMVGVHGDVTESDAEIFLLSVGGQVDIPISSKMAFELVGQVFYWREQLAFYVRDESILWQNNRVGLMGEIGIKHTITQRFYIAVIMKQFHNRATGIGLKLGYKL